MSKTSSEQLIRDIAKDLVGFLKNGSIETFSRKIDADLNIDDLEKLLKIHFLLKDDVIKFVNSMPEKIKRIKTTTRIFEDDSDSEVRGKIIWDRTFRRRLKKGSLKGTSFITSNNERNYAIPENLVLEELLGTINSIIEKELKKAFDSDYSWISKWVDKDSKKVLQDVYLRNIYLRRIKDQKTRDVTDRMIDQTTRSRNILYKEAANLLLSYRRLMNYELNDKEAMDLLNSAFIKPDRPEVLFELYWTIKLIKEHSKNSKDGKPKYMILDEGNNIVAKWKDGKFIYKIFHDSTGSLKFFETLDEVVPPRDEGYIDRDINAKRKWIDYRKEIFGTESGEGLWGGRPDIILEQYDKDSSKLCKVIIGEVKYTEDRNYASKGLKELMEYMSFVKNNEGYFTEYVREIFESDRVTGVLCIDDIKINKNTVGNIKILTVNQKI